MKKAIIFIVCCILGLVLMYFDLKEYHKRGKAPQEIVDIWNARIQEPTKVMVVESYNECAEKANRER